MRGGDEGVKQVGNGEQGRSHHVGRVGTDYLFLVPLVVR